jgi:iron complex transport system permease protein
MLMERAASGKPPRKAVQNLPRRRSREVVVIASLALAFGAVFLLSLALGSVWIPLNQILAILTGGESLDEGASVVIYDVRLPRAITAILAGAALGIAGLQMQTIFRNPLADPFVLGISSGASLGVALVILTAGAARIGRFGSSVGLAGDALLTLAAIAGAAATLILVLAVSVRIANPATVLILGLMFGYGSSALVTVLVAGTSPEQLQRWMSWGFGSFSGVTWERLQLFGPLVAIGILVAAATTKHLNALLLGEHYAHSMGLRVRRTQVITMIGASILGGVVTAFCGPISFLGIAIPHMCRVLLASSDHRALVPAVVLMGGIVAMLAQIVALLPGSAGVLPLNAVTALIGAPIIVAVLLRSRRGIFTA